WPGGRIRPAAGRASILGLDDSEYAAEQDCRNQRCEKDQTRSCTHGDYPLFSELSPIREWQKSSATIQRPAIMDRHTASRSASAERFRRPRGRISLLEATLRHER